MRHVSRPFHIRTLIDRLARMVITVGGLATIVSILGIFFFFARSPAVHGAECEVANASVCRPCFKMKAQRRWRWMNIVRLPRSSPPARFNFRLGSGRPMVVDMPPS